MEQPSLTSGEGSSALVRVQPEPRGWDSPCVLWRSRDDPEGEPLSTLEDVDEGGHWGSLEQFHLLVERSLRTALSVVAEDLPGVARVRAFLSCTALSFLQALSQFFDVCSAYQELEAWYLEKSMFLRRERGI